MAAKQKALGELLKWPAPRMTVLMKRLPESYWVAEPIDVLERNAKTIDAAGDMWLAICEGGVVLQLSPEGAVRRAIEMPTKLPASCMFFGPNLDRLFVPSIDPSFLGR